MPSPCLSFPACSPPASQAVSFPAGQPPSAEGAPPPKRTRGPGKRGGGTVSSSIPPSRCPEDVGDSAHLPPPPGAWPVPPSPAPAWDPPRRRGPHQLLRSAPISPRPVHSSQTASSPGDRGTEGDRRTPRGAAGPPQRAAAPRPRSLPRPHRPCPRTSPQSCKYSAHGPRPAAAPRRVPVAPGPFAGSRPQPAEGKGWEPQICYNFFL